MVELKTPCYVIDADCFKKNLRMFHEAFSKKWYGALKIGYSIKTNHDQSFLQMARKQGMLAEAVSDDEYKAAILAGYTSESIIYNGPQKSGQLLEKVLQDGGIINIDNAEELKVIEKIKCQSGRITAQIGLRVNFDLEKACPGETSAGNQVSRFGFCFENGEFAEAVKRLRLLGIEISGLHLHYSTKTRSEKIFQELAHMAVVLINKFNLQDEIKFIDIGGGFFLGDDFFSKGKPSLDTYATVIVKELTKGISSQKVTLILEPGSALLATAVTYITKIINERMVRGVKVLTVDGSKLHINPFMFHRNVLYDVKYSGIVERKNYPEQIICGATCMENDRFDFLNCQKELFMGDMIRCKCVGAYTMGFNNCFINLPPYVYLKENEKIKLVREKDINLLTKI